MFGFMDMMGNYESRKIDRFEKDDLLISTARVTDNDQFPYETAISHPDYNSGKFVIVQQYKTKEEARICHNEWVAKMTAENLPDTLEDVSTCEIAKFVKGLY